ncbi:phosphoglucosamine mutase [Mycoplasmatota bacterium WC44]
MKKYFGTDGIRGVANEYLTPELSYRLGRVLGLRIRYGYVKEPYVYVGKDTRMSCDLLEYSIICGFLSVGVNVKRLHVIPTPGVAYLTASTEASMGVMISASHNPFYDNGIKLFSSNGMKLSDEEELEIEELLDNDDSKGRSINENVGIVLNRHESMYQYIESLFFSVKNRFDGLKIGLDCANGATFNIVNRLFTRLGAEVTIINDNPDGMNINDKCGATDLKDIRNLVLLENLDIGFAFDGDGDRVMAIDELGNIIDGDFILYIMGKYFKDNSSLSNNNIVTTTMSNMGLYKALERIDITSTQTDVGDRYVLKEMLDKGYNLGGEQSGHVIMLDYNTCGDGMLVALQLTSIVKESGLTISEMVKDMKKYPQLLGKVKVTDKEEIMNNKNFLEVIEKCDSELGDEGRVLVRPSGTEPVIRIMVEAKDELLCQKYYDEVYNTLNNIIN